MVETHEVVVKEAEASDIPGVIACMQANLVDIMDNDKQGRLFYHIPSWEFMECLDNPNNIFICAKKWNKVLWYVLTYDLKLRMQKNPTRIDDIQVVPDMREKLKNEKILYGHQVATHPDHRNNGISKTLEMKTYVESVRQWYTYTIAEIMKEPRENTNSMIVHQKVGFEKIWEINYPNGTTRNIMGRSL